MPINKLWSEYTHTVHLDINSGYFCTIIAKYGLQAESIYYQALYRKEVNWPLD